jgi:hypothetical protein
LAGFSPASDRYRRPFFPFPKVSGGICSSNGSIGGTAKGTIPSDRVMVDVDANWVFRGTAALVIAVIPPVRILSRVACQRLRSSPKLK